MDFFKEKNISLEDYVELNPKELKIRKKLYIYLKDMSVVIYTEQKSRILQKDVESFEKIIETIEEYQKQTIKEKMILINSPLCSKAKAKFEQFHWKVIS